MQLDCYSWPRSAFLIEYLDDTLKTPEDIERSLGLSVIGFVTNIEYSVKDKKEVYVLEQPRSPVSEAFRLLRTNLEFSGIDKPLRTILVTSAGPCEGKTTVSVNLAASIAQGGKSVILLDTDLRRPQIHTFLICRITPALATSSEGATYHSKW